MKKRIESCTDEELEKAIYEANLHCSSNGLDFYKILRGIDAYICRRKRLDDREHQKAIKNYIDIRRHVGIQLMTKEPFKEDIDRDAMILQAQLSGKTLSRIAPLVMQLPEFAGGPDRLTAYANWISHPSRREYRRKVANHMSKIEGQT